jgi:hypothetical protein
MAVPMSSTSASASASRMHMAVSSLASLFRVLVNRTCIPPAHSSASPTTITTALNIPMAGGGGGLHCIAVILTRAVVLLQHHSAHHRRDAIRGGSYRRV